jgi:2-phosphosulfolactate phosphatase
MTAFYDQTECAVRFEWGEHGVTTLAPQSDVVVIVDVLSFSTCVDIATGNGAVILPYRWQDESAAAFAASQRALLAGARWSSTGGYSLSPASLVTILPGTRLVLPSPNGATLTLLAERTTVLAGCLRNATAVAAMAEHLGRAITVIAAGERWGDGSLRPAVEDLLGAGAIINALSGTRSPEAAAAAAAFCAVQAHLADTLRRCTSGKELIIRGFAMDVDLAGRLDCSTAVPRLYEGVYSNHAGYACLAQKRASTC